MKQLQLSNGGFCLVDDDDFEKLINKKWYFRKREKTSYVLRKKRPGRGSTNILMHREIMNAPENVEVDHVDGDGLNNQKSNLRLCNHKQNMHNSRIRKDNTSGYKGVYFHKRLKKYIAYINCKPKRLHLGVFVNPIDAAIAYNSEARKLFGEFAKLNKVNLDG